MAISPRVVKELLVVVPFDDSVAHLEHCICCALVKLNPFVTDISAKTKVFEVEVGMCGRSTPTDAQLRQIETRFKRAGWKKMKWFYQPGAQIATVRLHC